MPLVSYFPGLIVGLSIGLTGGGGAILALPLLVYLLGVEPRSAVGVSLVTVAVTAVLSFLQRARQGLVEYPTGLLFAAAGMLTAPLGAWLSRRIADGALMLLLGLLIVVVAARMWRMPPEVTLASGPDPDRPTCRRDPQGRLLLSSPCAALLSLVGLLSGLLAGLFGVGGGFIIVPSLVTFSGMGAQRAVGTSLLVISLVSLIGLLSHVVGGGTIPWAVALWFLGGSATGAFVAAAIARHLNNAQLQRLFAAVLLAVGLFILVRHLGS